MNPTARRFLLWSFFISYPCFVILIWLERVSPEWWHGPVRYLLLVLGCLGPIIGGMAAGEERDEFKKPPEVSREWFLAAQFLGLHYVLLFFLRIIGPAADGEQKLLRLFPMILLLGAQELGWRRVLQPALERSRKSWKATAATGLITSLWFLPLLFLPWFPVRAETYLPFAVWLLGLSFLQSALYRRTGSIHCTALFTAVFFLLAGILPMVNENAYYVAGGLDILMAFLYQSRLIKENERARVPVKHKG